MNGRDHEMFEAELRKLAPARPPAELMTKLAASRPLALQQSSDAPGRREVALRPRPSALNPPPIWRLLLRWLAPAAAVGAVAAALLVWRPFRPESQRRADLPATADKPALKADDVEIDEHLVAAFDAVATLPNGLPVRFRCREWADQVTLRDSVRGLVIEQRAPRLEVVPVSFETY